MESLGSLAVAYQTDEFERGTFPEDVQNVNRRDGVVIEGTTFERDETSDL